MDKRRGSSACVCARLGSCVEILLSEERHSDTSPRQYSISSTALPASCPLLCLAHIANRRTQYAAKHWHSGTASVCCGQCYLRYSTACPARCTLYLRAMLACFLFRAVLVLLIGRGRDLEKSLLAFTRIHMFLYRRHLVLVPSRIKEIRDNSHSISCT
jgi:hypothetical protein